MATNAFAAGAYSAIQGLGQNIGGPRPGLGGLSSGAERPDFGSLVQAAVGGAADTARAGEAQAVAAAMGNADIVDVVTAVAESEAAIETLVAVRDRMIQAYEEIMRMQI
jgi:flagellar hook-basal body complex protein FliE